MDIDIDFPSGIDYLPYFTTAIRASMISNDEIKPHTCGVYFQTLPVDKAKDTKLCAIPYKEAAQYGAMKIDFLSLTILNDYTSKAEIRDVVNREDHNWDALVDDDIIAQLFQLSKHADILKQIRPRSVQTLADCVAIIRPRKIKLLDQYLKSPDAIRPQLYRLENEDKSSFKRSHAISYALTILLQLNKLLEK